MSIKMVKLVIREEGLVMGNKKFPQDCIGCRNLRRFDMSIDDYTNQCIKHGWQVDDCDAYGAFAAVYCRYQGGCYEPRGGTYGN